MKKRLAFEILRVWALTMAPTIAATAWMVRAAYEARGYQAYGGEWMLLPFVLVLLASWTSAKVEAHRRHEEATRLSRGDHYGRG